MDWKELQEKLGLQVELNDENAVMVIVAAFHQLRNDTAVAVLKKVAASLEQTLKEETEKETAADEDAVTASLRMDPELDKRSARAFGRTLVT